MQMQLQQPLLANDKGSSLRMQSAALAMRGRFRVTFGWKAWALGPVLGETTEELKGLD